METKILGLSGRKQSGKNTTANYIVGCFIKALNIADANLNEKGELVLSNFMVETTLPEGVFDILSHDIETLKFIDEYLDGIVKVYSYADMLKRDVCMKILGLSETQCFGTDEQKNTLTHLNWEDMPGLVIPYMDDGATIEQARRTLGLIGPMSARAVMQYIGTEIFRKMYNNCWVDATIKQIKREHPLLAIITDVRFVNEVEGIRSVNIQSDYPCSGKVIRFLRDPNKGKDVHESETALDDYPMENYFAVIDNSNMSIDEQNAIVDALLREIQPEPWLPKI